MAKFTRVRTAIRESANTKAVRGLMIGLAASVVLVVSGFGTVIYIQLMGKIFPSGPLAIACYLGAAANFLLMIVLLVGKFVWFRPGWHELTSWLVTGSELLVAVFNLMLAYQLGNGAHPSGLLAVWLGLAPISPVFSMVGATLLIMTSVEMRKRHRDLELQEEKEQSERELELAFHHAEIDVKHQYLDIISEKLTQELSAPERHKEIAAHAKVMVSQVLSEISGIQSLLLDVPVAPPPAISQPSSASPSSLPTMSHRPTALPAAVPHGAPAELDESWLEQVNERIEQERARRMAVAGTDDGAEEAVAANRLGSGSERVIRFVVREWMKQFQGRSADGSVALRRVEEQYGLFDETAAKEGVKLPLLSRLTSIAAKMLAMGYKGEEVARMGSELFPPDGEAEASDALSESDEGPSRAELRVTRQFL